MDNSIIHPVLAFIPTPLGFIEIRSDEGAITGLLFSDKNREEVVPHELSEAVRQLKLYFEGRLKVFDLPVCLKGTDFQHSVWDILLDVPYGSTTTYGEIAGKLGLKNGARAVGLANGSNPVAIIVPCHRVIGIDGKLTGYRGGLWRKEWLLKMELRDLNKGLFRK